MKETVLFFTQLADKYYRIYLPKEVIYAAITVASKRLVFNFKYKSLSISIRYDVSEETFRLSMLDKDRLISVTTDNVLEIVYLKKYSKPEIEPFDWGDFEQ